ncbi:MAG: FlgD immunoglobulin-like domain containing protein [Candidatus Eisenbacteria bacterium]|nr:FlgD immunoglobulin-like domain containing protein [Candidatus Eisenbacteria bacterium]
MNGRIQRFGDVSADVPASGGRILASLALRAITPNPSRGEVALVYSVPRSERVVVTVADLSGRRVATLADAPVSAGQHQLSWVPRGEDGRRLPTGTYFVRVQGESGASVGRLILLQ